MSKKSDYFFVNIKQIYPTFSRPSILDVEIWEEVLEPYDLDEIMAGIKSYRKNEETNFAPNPCKFKKYLFSKYKPNKKFELPLSPEKYLMEQDIKAGRCVHLFPTYAKAVEYVLDEKLAELYTKDEFKKFSRGMRYHLAVENGLFADFDKTLDFVKRR